MSRDLDQLEIIDSAAANRYEARIAGELAATCDYRISDTTIVFPHTETAPAYRGRGIAARLVEFALNDARSRGLTIVSRCSFVDEFLADHPEYAA